MSNLAKKGLLSSTVFQYGLIADCMVWYLYWDDPSVTAAMLITVITTGFAAYVAKEGIAKGSEAYRDRGM